MANLDPLPREQLPQYEDFFVRYDKIRDFLPKRVIGPKGWTAGKHGWFSI